MPTLIISLLLAAFFAAAGILIWLILYLFHYRNHGKRTMRISALAYLVTLPLTLFVVLPILFSTLIANAGTRPRDRQITTTPADFGREFEQVSFSSRDGVKLSGWLMKGTSDHPALIIGHGLFRSRQEVLERGCLLNELGYTAMLFDFRCHGKSEGKTISLGYLERLDILGAADHLRTRSYNTSRTVFCGVSMGAVASILAAREASDSPLALIAESPFISLEKTVARHTWQFFQLPGFPFADLFVWNLGRLAGFDPSSLDTRNALSKIENVPTLFIYGTEDERMPRHVAEELYAVSGESKKLIFFEGARHGKAFETDPNRYIASIDEFVKVNF